MTVPLKIFTLNCWGLPFPVICKNRPERMHAIGEFLNRQDYDIIVLEEIWVKSDFHKLREVLKKKLPFSHYFYSGAIGSGMCVFSKHIITETLYHRFHLNGQAHKIYHGDWFGGKGVGLCKIQGDLNINVYCSHFHADYNPEHDEYQAHRLTQAFELSQFVRATSVDCDLVIVAGDLNSPPYKICYKVMTHNAQLEDTWLNKNNQVDDQHGGTCEVPGNSYTSVNMLEKYPQGSRIDYIMYCASSKYEVTVTECIAGGLGTVSGYNVSYSDHEPVIASLSVKKMHDGEERRNKTGMSKELRETLHESLLVLDKGVSQCISEEKFFQLMVFLLSLLLYLANAYIDPTDHDNQLVVSFSLAVIKLSLSIAIGFCTWIALIVKRAEFHGLVACKEDIMKLLGAFGACLTLMSMSFHKFNPLTEMERSDADSL